MPSNVPSSSQTPPRSTSPASAVASSSQSRTSPTEGSAADALETSAHDTRPASPTPPGASHVGGLAPRRDWRETRSELLQGLKEQARFTENLAATRQKLYASHTRYLESLQRSLEESDVLLTQTQGVLDLSVDQQRARRRVSHLARRQELLAGLFVPDVSDRQFYARCEALVRCETSLQQNEFSSAGASPFFQGPNGPQRLDTVAARCARHLRLMAQKHDAVARFNSDNALAKVQEANGLFLQAEIKELEYQIFAELATIDSDSARAQLEKGLQEGMEVNPKSDWKPLLLACMNPNPLPGVKIVLEHHADPNAKTLQEGWSPLYIAARDTIDPAPLLTALLEAGARVEDATSHSGLTPLFALADAERLSHTIFITLQRRADGDGPSGQRAPSASDAPTGSGSVSTTRFTRTEAQQQQFAQRSTLNSMKTLLRAGFNVNTHDPRGNPVLFYALTRPHERAAMVRLLLSHGADARHLAPDGWSAAHSLASSYGDDLSETAALLREAGVAFWGKAQSLQNRVCLYGNLGGEETSERWASMLDQLDTIEGPKLPYLPKRDLTVFHIAALKSAQPDMILRCLIDEAVNAFRDDPNGPAKLRDLLNASAGDRVCTPLHLLLQRGDYPEAVCLLLQHGADMEARLELGHDKKLNGLELADEMQRPHSRRVLQEFADRDTGKVTR